MTRPVFETGKGYLIEGKGRTSGIFKAAAEQGLTVEVIRTAELDCMPPVNSFQEAVKAAIAKDPQAVLIVEMQEPSDYRAIQDILTEAVQEGRIFLGRGEEQLDVSQNIFVVDTRKPIEAHLQDRLQRLDLSPRP